MNVSAVLSSLPDPYASGWVLSRLSPRGSLLGVGGAQPIERVATARACKCGGPECPVCGGSRFNSEDTLELTAAPLEKEDEDITPCGTSPDVGVRATPDRRFVHASYPAAVLVDTYA